MEINRDAMDFIITASESGTLLGQRLYGLRDYDIVTSVCHPQVHSVPTTTTLATEAATTQPSPLQTITTTERSSGHRSSSPPVEAALVPHS